MKKINHIKKKKINNNKMINHYWYDMDVGGDVVIVGEPAGR